MSIELSAANFEQETQVAGPVTVDFWAPWCNPVPDAGACFGRACEGQARGKGVQSEYRRRAGPGRALWRDEHSHCGVPAGWRGKKPQRGPDAEGQVDCRSWAVRLQEIKEKRRLFQLERGGVLYARKKRKGAFFRAGNNRRRLWHAVNACSHCWCPFSKR